MSRSVFVTTYEVIGDGLPIAAEHFAEVKAAKAAHWQFVESVGGIGFRPTSCGGGLRSVFFTDVPTGWRKIGKDRDNIECVPHKSSFAGRGIAKVIGALPTAPDAINLARKLGYTPNEMAMDGTCIFFPTTLQVSFPAERAFLRLPRFAGDKFEPDPAILQALPESEFMKALEDHNAEARRQYEMGEPT